MPRLLPVALLQIVNSIVMVAIWKHHKGQTSNQIALLEELRGSQRLLLAKSAALEDKTKDIKTMHCIAEAPCTDREESREGTETIHEKAKGIDFKIQAAQAEAEDIRKRLQSIDDSASAATAAADSLREEIVELRGENESLKDQLSEMRDKISGKQQAAVAEFEVASLSSPGDEEELHGVNGSLKDLIKDRIQESIAEEQQDNQVPLSPTSIIGFDNVSTTTDVGYIRSGYFGLNWKYCYVAHRSLYPGSGFEYGIVSGDYVAWGYVMPCTISSPRPFSVAGFQATAAWRKNLNVLVQGFDNNGNRIGSYQATLGDPRGGPSFIDLRREGNFEGLHKLKVTPSGGTDAGLGHDDERVAIDDLVVY